MYKITLNGESHLFYTGDGSFLRLTKKILKREYTKSFFKKQKAMVMKISWKLNVIHWKNMTADFTVYPWDLSINYIDKYYLKECKNSCHICISVSLAHCLIHRRHLNIGWIDEAVLYFYYNINNTLYLHYADKENAMCLWT